MKLLRWPLALAAIVANLAVGAFLLGVGYIGLSEGSDLEFPWVPWTDPADMALRMVILGLIAIVVSLLALRLTAFRYLMLLWNLGVVVAVVHAFLDSSFKFDGHDGLWNWIYIFLLSLIALIGAIALLRKPKKK